MQHGTYEERECGSAEAPQESVCGDGAGGVAALKSVDEVVECGLEDGEEADADEGRADARGDPVHAPTGRPREQEQARGEEDGADHHGWQAGLWHGDVAVESESLRVVALVAEVDGCADDHAREEGEEGECADDLVPASLLLEFDGECG